MPYYVIMREILVHKSLYDHLTRMITVDEIINMNASKVPCQARPKINANACRYCNANAT